MKFAKMIMIATAVLATVNGLTAAESATDETKKIPKPAAHWAMEEISEGGIIRDIAGGHDAKVCTDKQRKSRIGGKLLPEFEPQIVPGVAGNAISLVGSQQGYLAVPGTRDFSPANGLTVMAWINPVKQENMDIITCKPDSDDAKDGWRLRHSWGTVIFEAVDVNGKLVRVKSDKNTVHERKWQHVAVVIGKDKIRLYLNGNECSSVELTSPLAEPKLPLIIGNHATIAGWTHEKCPAFDGSLDEVMIFSQPLDEATISQISVQNLNASANKTP